MDRIAMAFVLALGLAACGGGSDTLAGRGDAAATDARPLIAELVDLSVMQTPGGAVVTATGRAERQGFWDGALVPIETGDPGILAYGFRVQPPAAATSVSTPRSRDVTVALELTNRELLGVRQIQVSSAGNSSAVSR